jgi:hypothetical protein
MGAAASAAPCWRVAAADLVRNVSAAVAASEDEELQPRAIELLTLRLLFDAMTASQG